MIPSIGSDFLQQVDATIQRALLSGALQPIETEQATLDDQGVAFQVRWVSSLAHKDAQRKPAAPRPANFNPFLPPEPDLLVCEAGPHHRVLLNKFPVMSRHALLVTRLFEPQSAPLSEADWLATADLLQAADGLVFYNGGETAGASQPHRHLQWISGNSLSADFLPMLPALQGQTPPLPWRHAFQPLPHCQASALSSSFQEACQRLDLQPTAGVMPPYNLLLTRQWMLVVPRNAEHWQDVSVNALGFAGSLFVRRTAQIDALRAAGPMAVLRATGFPAS